MKKRATGAKEKFRVGNGYITRGSVAESLNDAVEHGKPKFKSNDKRLTTKVLRAFAARLNKEWRDIPHTGERREDQFDDYVYQPCLEQLADSL